MTKDVASVYQKLNDSDKKKACILAGNYGEAGALHYYGPKYGLPEPICGHNIWYFWGPGNYTEDVMIIICPSVIYELLTKNFDSVEIAEKTKIKYAMPYENKSEIFLCRGSHWPNMPLKETWKNFKHFE